MIGKKIGKYRIVGQLGRGGMGTVYKAVDETLDRPVAIKVLNPELADSTIMKRFRAEATTLAKLNHPEIATIYELFRSETDLLIVMEFVRGETLEKISVRMGALPPDRAAYLIDKILSALEHAHRAGIVHCDIKPANVMVTEHGGVKIMDFGTARVRGAEHATADRYMMGTPAYMSPEQVLGQELDGRADLYAVGVVFYRLLTANLPFNADTAIAMVQKQLSDTPSPLDAHRLGLPDWCETILQRALAKSPADRFQTAEQFRETLGQATGMITTELTKTLAISVAELETTAPAQSGVLEHFGLTPVRGPAAHTLVLEDASGSESSPPETSGWRLGGPLLAIVAAGIAAMAIVGLWRPRDEPVDEGSAAPLVEVPHKASAPLVEESSKASAPPGERPGKPTAPPFVFEARALVGAGNRQRERKSRVVLADGQISVKASDSRTPLHEVPYDQVLSISYSQATDPLWKAPTGPKRVTRANTGRLGRFGIFVARDWVSLRTTNADAQFVVLRFDNEAQAWRAITALEKRTGRKADIVGQR